MIWQEVKLSSSKSGVYTEQEIENRETQKLIEQAVFEPVAGGRVQTSQTRTFHV